MAQAVNDRVLAAVTEGPATKGEDGFGRQVRVKRHAPDAFHLPHMLATHQAARVAPGREDLG